MSPLIAGLIKTLDEERKEHKWAECHMTVNTMISNSEDDFMRKQCESIKNNLPLED